MRVNPAVCVIANPETRDPVSSALAAVIAAPAFCLPQGGLSDKGPAVRTLETNNPILFQKKVESLGCHLANRTIF
jgi:hypothetical protein